MKRVVLKLSGEALGGKSGVGVDPIVITDLAKEIKAAYDLKTYEIGIVVGGGNFCRGRDAEKIRSVKPAEKEKPARKPRATVIDAKIP